MIKVLKRICKFTETSVKCTILYFLPHQWGTISCQANGAVCQLLGLSQVQFSSIKLLRRVRLFAAPWTAACQASLSITNSQSLLKLMSIELVMPSNHLSLCCPFLLLPSIFLRIRDFSNELALRIRWPKYWSFSFSIRPSNKHSGLIFFRTNCFDFLSVRGTLKSLP